MKFALMVLTVIASTSALGSTINYSCTTLGGKSLAIDIDFSKVPKRLVSVLQDGTNITSSVTLEQGSKNTWAIVINGAARIDKTGTTTYTQTVAGGKPGAINCTPKTVANVSAPVKPLF